MWFVLCGLLAMQPSEPAWIDATGRLTADGREALALLADAAQEGLNPNQYDAPGLQARAARLAAGPRSTADVAAFDAALDSSLVQYFQHLHAGRVDPRSVGFRVPLHPREDLAPRLRAAVAAHRLAAFADEMAPSIPLYRGLRAALVRYRALAADPSLPPIKLPRSPLRPGDRSVDLPAIRQRLAALGDLPADPTGAADSPVFDDRLAAAIERFQRRHGLTPDGIIGAGTRAALEVPIAWRVRQIELAMERLRWLPDRDGARLLGVNIAMFRVWAIDGSVPAFSSDVIVGRAVNTRTPVFVDALEQVIFRPYWNVPPSILRNEILPAITRDPEYLQKHNMEYVRDARGMRVRQRPGASNSLGLVKFAFPNSDNVYMHGTPAQALFTRPRRDFSHGCIRVADPVGLAEWILADESGWSRDRIVAAMNATVSSEVTLARPIRVVIFYMTAMVVPGEGTLRFADDIYRHDATLHRALEALCASRT